MITAVLVVVVVGLFWLAYRRPRPRRWLIPRRVGTPPYTGNRALAPATTGATAVDRQHVHLQAGGLLGENAFETTKAQFQALLANGRAAEVDGALRPGLNFAIQVRALAAIGTPEAGNLLLGQLGRVLTDDPAEQAWYWVDAAAGLRHMNRSDALPAVLRCADAATGLQQIVLSAEAIGFSNFPAVLHDLGSAAGVLAVRAVARAARGARDGVADLAGLVRSGLGDHLAAISETAPPAASPWLTAAMIEAERAERRAAHWARLLPVDARPLVGRQGARLATTATRRRDWLAGAHRRLMARFPTAPASEQAALLRTLDDLQADVSRLFPTVPDPRADGWADAVRCLRWADDPNLGPVLASQAGRWLIGQQPRATVVIGALRGHRSPEAEAVFLEATGSDDPRTREAGFGAFGWWDSFDTATVIGVLQGGRLDPTPAARRAAVAALARFGERAALREMAGRFTAEEPATRQAAVRMVATESISWLWPDLDALAETADPDTALAAAEAVERLREDTFGLIG